MTPKLLRQIEARDAVLRPLDVPTLAEGDRRALLTYVRELEASLAKYQTCRVHDADEKNWLRDQKTLLEAALDWALADIGEELQHLELPPHLAPILESSRKRITGSDKT